jgi:predicted NUDIX family NTP pyrophosphohydrolase
MASKSCSSTPAARSGETRTTERGLSRRANSKEENPEQTARREFDEELGSAASIGPLRPLGAIRQRGGKRVVAFYGEGEFDPARLVSNSFEIEWPPRSGRLQTFPEIDRAEWFDLDTAKAKILSGQVELIDRLAKLGV